MNKGVLKSETQLKRDELIERMKHDASEVEKTTSQYISWSDNRLRAYLRDHGVPVKQLPSKRDDLLHLMKGYYQESATWEPLKHFENSAHSMVDSVKNVVRDFLGTPAHEIHGYNQEKFYSLSKAASSSASSLSKQLEKSASHASASIKDEL